MQLERDRERLQRKVVKAVDRLEAKGVLREMRRATKRILRKAASAAENVQTPAAYAQTRRHILRQLDELLRHQDSLADPDDRQRHHAMRIAAKRLRYTLEIARPVYPGRLEEAVEAIKRVQSLLGDVHDCDVWAEHLDAFASTERRPHHGAVRPCRPVGPFAAGNRLSAAGSAAASSGGFRAARGVLGRIGPAAVLGRPDGRGAGRRPVVCRGRSSQSGGGSATAAPTSDPTTAARNCRRGADVPAPTLAQPTARQRELPPAPGKPERGRRSMDRTGSGTHPADRS